MAAEFFIHVDRLRDGEMLPLEVEIPSDVMSIKEDEIQFNHPIKVNGQAYLADDHLIIHYDVCTYVTLPCAICNAMTPLLVELKNSYFTEPLSGIRSGTFDYSAALRDAILLETPPYTECADGLCPERVFVEKYLVSEGSIKKTSPDVYFPFGDLDEKELS